MQINKFISLCISRREYVLVNNAFKNDLHIFLREKNNACMNLNLCAGWRQQQLFLRYIFTNIWFFKVANKNS